MSKAILFIILCFLIGGCLQQRVNPGWEDSNLTKKEYLRRKVERAESKQADEGAWDKILDPSW
tara:strand:+ start:1868 stop:2056 length:189 start_codon:yes stop_codon:yes gene_type:complete